MSGLTDAMLEYAQAIRGDWSDFDGRSERDVIYSWVSELNNPTDKTLDQWRVELGICLDGNGHWAGFGWSGHCSEERCPKSHALLGDLE